MLVLTSLENNDQVALERWFHSLLDSIQRAEGAQHFEACLTGILKRNPELIQSVESWCLEHSASRIGVYLAAMLACKRNGVLQIDCNDSTLKNTLIRGLEHVDDKVKK